MSRDSGKLNMPTFLQVIDPLKPEAHLDVNNSQFFIENTIRLKCKETELFILRIAWNP